MKFQIENDHVREFVVSERVRNVGPLIEFFNHFIRSEVSGITDFLLSARVLLTETFLPMENILLNRNKF